MIYAVCSFYDVKANDFGVPFHAGNKEMAIRLFGDLIVHGSDLMSKHPDDFYLYLLGTYDSSDGFIESLPKPERICSGAELLVMAVPRGAAVGGETPLKSQSVPVPVSDQDALEVN